jgi:hypothetical protein
VLRVLAVVVVLAGRRALTPHVAQVTRLEVAEALELEAA